MAGKGQEKEEIFRIPPEGKESHYKSNYLVTKFNVRELGESLVSVGEGGFGEVYKAYLPVAVKVFEHGQNPKGRENKLSDLEKEMNVYLRIPEHPNIVRLIGYCQDEVRHIMILEYVKGENLEKVLTNPEDTLFERWGLHVDIARQIANGLQHLHNVTPNAIIHMDLSPANVLVVKDEENLMYHCKITDFGLSKTRGVSTREGKYPPYVGRQGYIAPERYDGRTEGSLNAKVDVFSFGIMMWAIRHRKRPFEDKETKEVPTFITSGGRPPVTPSRSQAYDVLMTECWDQIPERRPESKDVHRRLCAIHDESSKMEL
jgi:serine/threonine protein kinase